MRRYSVTVRASFDGHRQVYHTTAHCQTDADAVTYALWLVWNKFPRGEMWRDRQYMIDGDDWVGVD